MVRALLIREGFWPAMPRLASALTGPKWAAWVALPLLLGLGGCRPPEPADLAGVELTPPEGWRATRPTLWPVPGEAVAAWLGPGGASLVVYRTLPDPRPSAEALAIEVANRYENLPGLKVLAHRVETVAGRPAAWVEAVGPGTGDAFAPSGTGAPVAPAGRSLVATRRVLVAIPRQADTLALVWHGPESTAEALASAAAATLKTLRLRDEPPPRSSY